MGRKIERLKDTKGREPENRHFIDIKEHFILLNHLQIGASRMSLAQYPTLNWAIWVLILAHLNAPTL